MLQLFCKELDRHKVTGLNVSRQKDVGHAAPANPVKDDIPTAK